MTTDGETIQKEGEREGDYVGKATELYNNCLCNRRAVTDTLIGADLQACGGFSASPAHRHSQALTHERTFAANSSVFSVGIYLSYHQLAGVLHAASHTDTKAALINICMLTKEQTCVKRYNEVNTG